MGITWTNKEVVHLLLRAGFGSTTEEVNACVALGREETVRRLIAGEALIETAPLTPFEQLHAEGKKSLDPLQLADQQMYWLYRMVNSSAPLVEKMTLFWHGHFATANYKVKDVTLMVQQNTLFRNHALGSFKELVLAVGKDPAMMIWLDVNRNKKNKPNENYAREVMELFTLGIGHYSETDVKEAARAFTGWTYSEKENKVAFNSKQHDNDTKTLLGETGNLGSDEAIDVIFHQKSLTTFLAAKLLTYFAADNPSESWVQQVAGHIAEKATIGEVLSELFLSDDFYNPALRLSLIKTPADYVAGILKMLKVTVAKGHAQAMRRMGQELFSPPDVAGWRGGTSWLNTNLLLARYQFAESITMQITGKKLVSPELTPQRPQLSEEWVKLWSERLGITNLSDKTLQGISGYVEDTVVHAKMKNAGLRGLLQLILISPEAQMK
ncbi:DUF1800 domain-containing protein [Paenibacillus aceris]|uniref:Uncharacterized protein (DUF1800 family) n=1 Tax=Paenibacillus aceris TaxID=869555 RepID=A0ABS4HUS8_9BACL|nr:DUF1800 domain-containing protein [Paenibacillus aceris]MBP1962367.1 uncharacterized protein (DUF1800 family) [Paenibacillus aceris]NHW37183.1 DUF1800 domain-containing protein [Paenibacillus aceris]